MKPTKMAWEEWYGDDSGIEYAVRYDAEADDINGCRGVIELERIEIGKFPADSGTR